MTLVCCAPCHAVAGIDWPGLANTVITIVVPKRDMAVPLLALAFAQDRAGFLWAGGETGLFRWDGYQLRAYTGGDVGGGAAVNPGPARHFIHALHTDRAGRLWAGTDAGGLLRYDDATDMFQPVKLADRTGAAQCVWSVDDDGAGGLWIGTDRGLAHLDAAGRVVPPAAAGTPHGGKAEAAVFAAPGGAVEAVLTSRDGTLWIGGGDGLARIAANAGGGAATPAGAMAVALPVPGGGVAEVSHLMQDSAGRIWAGTRHHGAYAVDPRGRQGIAVALPPGLTVQESGLEIMALAEPEPGRIWLGTFGHGIIDVQAGTMTSHVLVRDPLVPATLDSDLVYGMFKDRSGITWIGTTAGLDRFMPTGGAVHTLFARAAMDAGQAAAPGNATGRTGFPPAEVTGVLARPDGTVWLASQTDGLRILGADGQSVRTLPVPRVLSMAAADDGPVYIGTRNGLFVADRSGDHVTQVTLPGRRRNAGVFALAVFGGAVWVGGDSDEGLLELRPAPGGLAPVRRIAAPPLPNASIGTVGPAPGGLVAIGTGSGLALLDPATGAVVPIMPVGAGQDGPGPTLGRVASTLTDRRGRLWIGTSEGGIAVLLRRDAQGKSVLRWITVAEGLPDPDINRMLEDESGRIWAATDNGLAVIDAETFAVRALREADGVAIATYWGSSGDRTRQGDLLFGGMGGLTVVRPDRLPAWHGQEGAAPSVAISDIHAGGKTMRRRDAELVIRPDANSLSVEFAALDFAAPERTLYRYRLDGFDAGFIATDARHRVAAYTNLPPGRYTLLVQGSDRNGAWGAPARLAIRVLPAWYQTAYCRFAEIAALAALCGAIVQGRTVWLRRRQHDLLALVRERTSALMARTEALIASERKLMQLAYVDALTGLPNRRSFNETIQALLDDPAKPPPGFVLILIDLDGFKHVNDTLGHDAGDAVLLAAAARLRAAVREDDVVTRLGGDEFAILLRGVDDPGVVRDVCDRLVAGMTPPIDIGGRQAQIGASVGAALATLHGHAAEDLYKHADEALYQAKRAGKGVWRWYQDATLAATASR